MLTFGDASKLIAARWKKLPQERKAHFEKLAAAERAAYQKKLQAFRREQASEEVGVPGPATAPTRPFLHPAPGAEVPNYPGIPVHNGMVPIQMQPGTFPVWIPMPPPGLSLPQHVHNLRAELEKVPLIPMGIPGLAPGGRPLADPGRLSPQGVPGEAPVPVQPAADLSALASLSSKACSHLRCSRPSISRIFPENTLILFFFGTVSRPCLIA